MEYTVELAHGLIQKVSDKQDSPVRKLIHVEITSFNDANSEHHEIARKTGINPLHVLVFNDQNEKEFYANKILEALYYFDN